MCVFTRVCVCVCMYVPACVCADPGSGKIMVMFKSGDDLRQDCVTLQMIRVMDKIWREHGLDFRLTPYRCVCVFACV